MINTLTRDSSPQWNFCFSSLLQSDITLILANNVIKTGKLILFNRAHYMIHMTLTHSDSSIETFDIPIPFKVEAYKDEKVWYFDYRVSTITRRVTANQLKGLFTRSKQLPFYDSILSIEGK